MPLGPIESNKVNVFDAGLGDLDALDVIKDLGLENNKSVLDTMNENSSGEFDFACVVPIANNEDSDLLVGKEQSDFEKSSVGETGIAVYARKKNEKRGKFYFKKGEHLLSNKNNSNKIHLLRKNKVVSSSNWKNFNYRLLSSTQFQIINDLYKRIMDNKIAREKKILNKKKSHRQLIDRKIIKRSTNEKEKLTIRTFVNIIKKNNFELQLKLSEIENEARHIKEERKKEKEEKMKNINETKNETENINERRRNEHMAKSTGREFLRKSRINAKVIRYVAL